MDGCINVDWVVENFKKEEFTFFEIGLASIAFSISSKLKKLIPNGKYYTFEPAEYWHESNRMHAKEMGINYIETAVSDIDGQLMFYPSMYQKGVVHKESSSIYKLRQQPGFDPNHKIYGEPYLIKSTKMETFCKDNGVTPDLIQIDVEGAELRLIKNMGEYKPKCIWTEISGFAHYDTETNIEEYNSFLESIGYYCVYVDPTYGGADALYCQNGFDITEYK